MTIAISVDNSYVSTGNVTIHVTGLQGDDSPVALYINDSLISSDISPGYRTSFDYTRSFNSKGIYTVKCNYRSTDSNVITLYVGYDFSIAFDEDDYYTCNSNCTVSTTLTEGNDPVEDATVSLTGTGSTLTATTDSNGVATFNLTNISQDVDLTVSYANSSDTGTVNYLDNTTLMGSLYCLGRRLEANLKAKGITDISFLDGLSTLVDEIPNIEPSIGGIVLDTALSITASSNSVDVGDTVTFTGKLSCSFDDETPSDDDMEGYIKTALIEVYNGNTLLGSTSTDSNGEYSYSYVTATAGTLSIVASYDGTDYYEDCVSSAVSVVVNDVTPVVDSISLTADKSILSYADGESATLSATVLDQFDNPMENETVEFFNGSTSMGTAQTDSSGVATKTYASSGVGDVSFTATVGSLVSETFVVHDRILNMSGVTDQTNNFGQNATILSDSNATITHDNTNQCYVATKTTRNGLVLIPLTALTGLSDIILEFDSYVPSHSTNAHNAGIGINTVGFYQLGGHNNQATSNIYDGGDNTSANTGHYDNEWIHHKFVISNGNVVWTAKRQNDTEIINRTHNVSITSTTKIGLSIGYHNTANARFKNIQVNPL